MTKSEYLAIAEKHYEAISNLKEKESFYEYEKAFAQIINDLGKEVLEQSIDEVPANHQKKTSSGHGSAK